MPLANLPYISASAELLNAGPPSAPRKMAEIQLVLTGARHGKHSAIDANELG